MNNISTNHAILKIENLTKRFTGVIAANNVNMEVCEKEIHAIIGENGAGKSTVCKLLTGIYQPDEGIITLFGKNVHFANPLEAMAAGIGMVYQERNIVGFLNGAQNICLGHEPQKAIFLNEKEIKTKAEEIRQRLSVDVPLDVPVEKLGAGMQQLIEIMRAFYMNPKLLILDEPTASLSQSEVEPFLANVKKMRDQLGISVIFISHKIEEVFSVADRVTIFADGCSIFTKDIAKTSQEECVEAMIKKGRIDPITVPDNNTRELEKVIEVASMVYDGKCHQLNFNTRFGEVVGFYGLVGSGRTEAMEAIFGIRQADKRDFIFANEKIEKTDSMDLIQKGMVMTPERRSNGVFLGLSVQDNVCNLFLKKLSSKYGFVNFDGARDFTSKVLEKNKVKFTDIGQDIAGLSGGNMQKVIIGRSIEVENLKLLILDEPTAGLDLGAKHEIYLKIRNLADEYNKSVIFISSELDELITTCDRIYVFFDGNITAEFQRKEFVKANIISAALKGKNNA